MIVMKLKINQEYYKLVPRPTPDEYEALKESIKTDGQEIPIIINGADEILDGFSRNQICNELGIEPKFVRRTFTNKNDEKIFVVEINLKRRHLTSFQKADMGFILEPFYAVRAKQNQIRKPILSTPIEVDKNYHETQTSEQTAKAVGISRATYERAKEVKEKNPDLWKQVQRQEISISSAHENVKLTENLTKEKQEIIAPKLGVIKYQSGQENLSQDEKKRVVEKLTSQGQKTRIENVDVERAVKTVKVESLTKDKSPEVQKKAKEIVEEKSRSGVRIQAVDVVREAEEDVKVQSLIPTSTPEQIKQMFASADPSVVAQNISKNTQRMTRKDLIQLIESMLSKNNLKCLKCGERKIKWKCGHDFE